MTDQHIEHKVAQPVESSDTQGRRAFMKGGLAVASGVMFTQVAEAKYDPKEAVQAYEGKEAVTEALEIPNARKGLGYPIRLYPYGMPSPYEEHVQKRTMNWLTPDTVASISFTPLQHLHGMIVPNGLHFDRYHGGTPNIDPKEHRLVIHGLVEKPLIFTVDDIKKFPSVSRIHFLECPANGALEWKGVQLDSVQWTHGMMACSEWTGVPLSTLLKEAGIKPEAKWIMPEGADASGMSRSLPITLAMDDCIVAWAQNGEAIRREHGYPLRLIVPGAEGNMWVKYLRRLKVSDQPWQHREETSKYTELQRDGSISRFSWVMEANSVITYPSPDFKMDGPGRYVVKGIAWSGRGKVEHVDVTFDGGRNWQEAKFTSEVLPKAWTRFELEFDWDGSELFLMSRTTDETGYVQPTMPAMRAVQGTNNVYHRTAMVTWHVHEWGSERQGEIDNVQY